MPHRIEPGQEYTACDPRDHIRIRIVVVPAVFAGLHGHDKVDIVTLTANGREVRPRRISMGKLHESGLTPGGMPRRTGYRLVRHADGTPAGGAR